VRPSPGIAKIVSTTTAPESSQPSAQPERLMPGSAACRTVCRSRTPVVLSPRARAETTKGCCIASRRLSRITWARKPASGTASVTTGSTSPAGVPVATGGSQPRPELKIAMSTAASQKCGSAAAVSSMPSPTAVEMRPRPVDQSERPSARIHASTRERSARSIVPPICAPRSSATGTLRAYDVPRSPLSSRPSIARYCTRSG
jgi:hypothetical protein